MFVEEWTYVRGGMDIGFQNSGFNEHKSHEGSAKGVIASLIEIH